MNFMLQNVTCHNLIPSHVHCAFVQHTNNHVVFSFLISKFCLCLCNHSVTCKSNVKQQFNPCWTSQPLWKGMTLFLNAKNLHAFRKWSVQSWSPARASTTMRHPRQNHISFIKLALLLSNSSPAFLDLADFLPLLGAGASVTSGAFLRPLLRVVGMLAARPSACEWRWVATAYSAVGKTDATSASTQIYFSRSSHEGWLHLRLGD